MSATVVTLDFEFRDTDHLRSEYHSFANLINVIHAELQLLERMAVADAGLHPVIRVCEAATWSFKDAEAARDHAADLMTFRSAVEDGMARVNPRPEYESDVAEAVAIVGQVIDEADLRVQEILARHKIQRPLITLDGQVATTQILAGAERSCPAERITVERPEQICLPHGLTEALGRLGGELLCTSSDHANVNIVTGEDRSTTITLETDRIETQVIPSRPPSGVDPASPADRTRALIALTCYVAGPGSTVEVDPGGSPFLCVRVAPA